MPNNEELSLKKCLDASTEEEVKNIFSRFFDFHLVTQFDIDALTEHCIFEFKLNHGFDTFEGRATTIAQALYYLHRLYKTDLVPSYLCIANKKQSCLFETETFRVIYESDRIDSFDVWDSEPSSPNHIIIEKVMSLSEVKNAYVYKYESDADILEFQTSLKRILAGRGNYCQQRITPRNIETVWTIWCNHFEEYVRNDSKHKPTFYFYMDIQEDRTYVVESIGENSKICFLFDRENGESKIVMLPTSEYENFWHRFRKLTDQSVIQSIQQKIYRLENTDIKKFQGMFYTPIKYAKRAFEMLTNALGENFWQSGQYRLWDMCAGTGNLEYDFPDDVFQYCYLSTLEEDEVKYCRDLFPNAKAIFQYDYLNDDVDFLKVSVLQEYGVRKMPSALLQDLENPEIKWIIFINPPYAEASESKAAGVKRKTGVNATKVGDWMKDIGLGQPAHELYSQFLFRISQELPLDRMFMGLFSTAKYMISSYNRNFRKNHFKAELLDGFVINSKSFSQCKGQFPICYALWDFSHDMQLDSQKLSFQIIDGNLSGIKTFVEPPKTINEWFVREKNTRIFPPFSSAIKQQQSSSSDVRDGVNEDFLGYLASGSPDMQNNKYTCIMSTPTGGHIGTSINPRNIDKSIVVNAVRTIIPLTWLNNRDQYSVPNKEISREFLLDCLLYDLFSNSNQTASVRSVQFKGQSYNVINNFFPFTKDCLNIQSRIDDSFISHYFTKDELSPEALNLWNKGRVLYLEFFKKLNEINKTKYKIDGLDYRVGWYQIRNALSELNDTRINQMLNDIKDSLVKLTDKLIPSVYEYGFLFE